jgi:selenocysteine-specific elongation factor
MPLTVGTAGHIDHGKTWLVRALTGKDTDRLPEEQARGVSIDLGYAPLDLPDGRRLSLVDVPGHERFVRTMVAGATGIDLFLLVIDATEGAKPQTHEHLAILRLLGVERGVVAVTKADAVDNETLELALEEARELVPGAQVVPVSAKTGDGLDELRSALAAVSVDETHEEAPTRLHVDRVFSLHGIGTVVTGTLWSGRIAACDALRAEPAGREVRVRSVQVHDTDVDVADAGQRVAVALPGVHRDELRRGDVLIKPGAYRPSYRLDVELDELAPIPARVLVHHGTSTTLARVARAGQFAQLRLAAPVVAARGDRVVLRAGTTVGGGVVIDPAPRRHASRPTERPEARLDELRKHLEQQLDAADPLDPGIPVPQHAGAEDVIAQLGLERRGAKLYRPGATATLGERAHEAAELERQLSLDPVKAEPRLARFLEDRGRLVRVGDGLAVSPAAYDHAREILVNECASTGRITLARFRDLLGTSRRTSQLLLERFDADGITRRIGDERVLRRSASSR